MAEPIERYTLTVEEKVTKPEQAKSVTPSDTAQTVLPDEGYALNRVNVGAIPPEYIVPTGKKTVTENETGIDITSYAELDVAVPMPPTPTYQTKSVTPTKQAQQVVPDTGYDALSEVDVAAIPSEYIVPAGSQNITENGNDIDISDKATVNVLVQPSLQDKTVTPTKQSQSVQADNGYYGLDTVTVNPIPNEYIVPTGTKSIAQNGTGIDVTDYAEVDVAVQPNLQTGEATPTTSTQTVTPDGQHDGFSSFQVNAIPSEYIVPTGKITITQNGNDIDIAPYATADVAVPQPQGKVTLSQNATDVDIAQYATADVAVPVGVFPSGTKEITQNGVSDVTNYASVDVQVPVPTMPDEYAIGGSLVAKTLTGYHFGNGVTKILPNYLFDACYDLVSAPMSDAVTQIGTNAFGGCKKLLLDKLPTSLTTMGSYAFTNCESITISVMPVGVTSIANNVFFGCYGITELTFLGDMTNITGKAFSNCTNCLKYDFRNNTAVPTLGNINAFTNISANCKIVVPDSLVSTWKAETNWATYADHIIGVTDYDNS